MAADDQNNSNGKPMNGTSSLEQQGKDLALEIKMRSAEEHNLRRRIVENNAILNIPAQLRDNLSSVPNQIGKVSMQLHRDSHTLRTKISSDINRRNEQFAGIVDREFSMTSVNGVAIQQRHSTEVAQRSAAMMSTPWDEMQSRRQQLEREMNGIQREAKSLVRGDPNEGRKGLYTSKTISDPNNKGQEAVYNRLGQLEARRNEIGVEFAAISAQERERKIQGMDPRSREERTSQYRAIANQQVAQEEARAKGSVSVFNPNTGVKEEIALKDVSKELSKAFKDLMDDTRKLATATEKEADAIKKRIEGHTDKIDDLKSVDGIRKDRWDTTRSTLSAAAGGFMAVGNAVQQIGVGQRLQQTANIAGYASIENQKYDQYMAARGGDVESMMMLGQWGQAKEFGKELFGAQQGANTAYAGGALAQTGVGVTRLAASSNPIDNVVNTSEAHNARIQGGLDTVSGLANTAVIGMDIARNTSASAAEISGIQADMGARREIINVKAKQIQQYRNMAVGSGTVAMGMGAAGEDFLRQVTDHGVADENMMRSRHGSPRRQTFTEKLAGARISPEQFNQMAQLGSDSMGSMFNTDQVFAARNIERSGMGSMSQNLQRMATLAQVGSNNPKDNLGNTLEMAVAKGLDSSKAMDMMVQNTASMVQQNATATAAGLDVSGAASSLLGAGMDAGMVNREFALQRSATAKDVAKDIMTNTDVSYSGMTNTSRISRTTGLSGDDAIYAAKITTEQLHTMKKDLAAAGDDPVKKAAAEEKVRKVLANQGVNANEFKGGLSGNIDKLLTASMQTLVEGGGVGLASGSAKDRQAIVEAMKKGDINQLSTEQLSLLGKIGSQRGVTGDELFRQGAAITNADEMNKPAGNKPTANEILAGEGGGDILKTIDTLRTSGFKQLAEQAATAQTSLENFGGVMQALIDMNADLEAVGTKGGEANFAEAAAEAAKSFGNITTNFGTHVSIFGSAVTAMAKKAGLNYDATAAEAQKAVKKLENAKDAKIGN